MDKLEQGVRVNRNIVIDNKVVDVDDILILVKELSKEYEVGKNNSESVLLKFLLQDADSTQYEGESEDIFLLDDMLSSKRIVFVEITFHNFSRDRKVAINLRQSPHKTIFHNKVDVYGRNEIWVNGIIHMIQNRIVKWQKQVTWPRHLVPLSLFVCAVGFVSSISSLSDSLKLFSYLKAQIGVVGTATIVVLLTLIAGGMGWRLGEWIPGVFSLYPRVELVTGPEHLRKEAKIRAQLNALVTIIIIPVLISFLFYLIT